MLWKRFIAILVLIPFIAGAAPSVDELRQQIQSKESQIKKLEAEIAEFQTSLEKQSTLSQSLKNQIKKLETQIKQLNTDIHLTETQIAKTELRISELSSEISDKQKQITKQKIVLSELLKSLNQTDDQSIIEVLLAYNKMSDFFTYQESSLTINKDIELGLQDLTSYKTDLERQRSAREAEEQEYALRKKDLAGRKAAQESTSQTKNQLLKDSKNQETRYQQLLKTREAQRNALQKEMQSIEDNLRKLIDPTLLPGKRSGVLGWPVSSPQITQGFGFTEFAKTYGSDVYNGNGHNGVDFKAPIGTRIIAAEDAVVKDTGNTDAVCPGGSYGRWIILEHNNNLSTLYAHLSSIGVTKGQAVKRGDIIGYSGDTGFVTGPHLHFTVYASNTYRLAQTRHCGLVPAGGYLNPLDYL